ncbi:hypothetical protein ACFX5K_03035 [Rickettsiales bacterium LUAb2]
MLKINIYSLKTSLHEENIDVAILPGLNGDIGVADGSRYLTYLLKEGIVYLKKNDQVVKRLFIFGGRFLAHDNVLNITTEYEVIDLDKITLEDIHLRVKAAEKKLTSATKVAYKDFYKDSLVKENKLLEVYKEKLY